MKALITIGIGLILLLLAFLSGSHEPLLLLPSQYADYQATELWRAMVGCFGALIFLCGCYWLLFKSKASQHGAPLINEEISFVLVPTRLDNRHRQPILEQIAQRVVDEQNILAPTARSSIPVLTQEEHLDLRKFFRVTIRWLQEANPRDGTTVLDVLYREEMPAPTFGCGTCKGVLWNPFPGVWGACPDCGEGVAALAEKVGRFINDPSKELAYQNLDTFRALCFQSKQRIGEIRCSIIEQMQSSNFLPVFDPEQDDLN